MAVTGSGAAGSGAQEPSDRPADDAANQPPKPPAHRWGLGAFLLAEATLLLSAVFISAILEPDNPAIIPASTVLVGTIVPTLLATGVALLATVLRGNGPLIDLRLAWRWDDVLVGLKLGALGLVLTVAAAYVWSEVVGQDDAQSAVGALVDARLPITAALVMFFYTWLIGPICEEVIFRGLCWGAMERLQWGRWAAFLLSTAIFAVSHLEPLRTTLLLVIAVPIGLARLITGRLLGSIVAHQVNNFLPALALLLVSLGVLQA